MRADAFDHARAQVFLNAGQGAGRYHGEALRLELHAIGFVVKPVPVALYKLTGRNGGGGAGNGHQIFVPLDLNAQHAEAALFAVKSDTLHRTADCLRLRFCGR